MYQKNSWTQLSLINDPVMQEYTSIIHISSIFAERRPVYVRLALWFLHHPAWMESHTGGSRLTPTVHPSPVQLGRLWVAYVSYEPNVPQEHAQPAQVIINLQSTKVCVFSDSVLCLGKVLQHPECNEAWKNRVAGVRAERSYRDFEDVSGESTEFEW